MLTAVRTPAPEIEISSVLSYQLVEEEDSDGFTRPVVLGSGKFARVYKAIQRSGERNVRPVAIKILHNYADLHYERLFGKEIELLKELGSSANLNTVKIVDIFRLDPLAMCGCGKLYHPLCPRCENRIQRRSPPSETDTFPILHCEKCNFEISAEHIQKNSVVAELLKAPSKKCCVSGRNAERGTLINFVEREVIVMELLDRQLRVFVEEHSRNAMPAAQGSETLQRIRCWLQEIRGDQKVLHQKVDLLEKVALMVQLSEAVAWLHNDQKIVHKDLAPDNIMVHSTTGEDEEHSWQGKSRQSLRSLMNRASRPSWGIKVIDFGLSDKEDLSRSWYQDDLRSGFTNTKLFYLSPEARLRTMDVAHGQSAMLEIDADKQRFRILPYMLASRLKIMRGDILADIHDTDHDHDLRIVDVVEEKGVSYASFVGKPPTRVADRQFQLVRTLGEPHDLFAVGALYYYILTGQTEHVDGLTTLTSSLEADRDGLVLSSLKKRSDYRLQSSLIENPRWRDPIMMLILRAMVRGKRESLVLSRADRGPRPSLALLDDTRAVYQGLQAEILAHERVRRLSLTLLMLSGLLLLAAILSVILLRR